MNNKQVLLQRAEEQFMKRDYTNALKIYSLILKDHPKLKEAEVGAYLSDMGMEYGDDAQALFDYYQAIKRSNSDADKIIGDLMQVISSTRVVIQEAFGRTSTPDVYEGGISYSDFIQTVENKHDFKKAFEDIMFSTKVVITKKEEFIDFLKRLIGAGYYDMVLGYLDTIAYDPIYDQDIYELYKLIPKDH